MEIIRFHEFQLDNKDNPNYNEIISLLPSVSHPETSTTLTRLKSLKDLILADLDEYYTYYGSLMMPPCKAVTWIDFKKSIALSRTQVIL